MSKIFQKPPNDYQYAVGLQNLVDFESTTITVNAPATNASLQDVVITAGAFAQDGQKVQVIGVGVFTNPNAPFQPSVTVNGTLVAAGSISSSALQRGFRIVVELFRQGNNLNVATTFFLGYGNNTTATVITMNGNYNILAAFDFTQNITVLFRGTDTAAPDAFSQHSSIADIE